MMRSRIRYRTSFQNPNTFNVLWISPGTGLGAGKNVKGIGVQKIKNGKYARFLLTGPYTQIWPAFDQMFKTLAENRVDLRPEYCIENYLNNPQQTPEDRLLTELLIPIA
jgi:DNA gyrase inhibitor GyrI